MTDDADLRDRTSQRAFELSQVAKDIAEGTNYEHFEMLYYDFDIEGKHNEYRKKLHLVGSKGSGCLYRYIITSPICEK